MSIIAFLRKKDRRSAAAPRVTLPSGIQEHKAGEQQCRVDVAADQRELFSENYQQQKTYGNNNSNHKMPPFKNLF